MAPALHQLETGLSGFRACVEMDFRPGRGCRSRLSAASRARAEAVFRPFSVPTPSPLNVEFKAVWGDVLSWCLFRDCGM